MNHLPGPWKLNKAWGILFLSTEGGELICKWKGDDFNPDQLDQIEANAKLISKAPEMYEILKALVNNSEKMLKTYDFYAVNEPKIKIAKLLLDKIEGNA